MQRRTGVPTQRATCLPLVYDEPKRLAPAKLAHERADLDQISLDGIEAHWLRGAIEPLISEIDGGQAVADE